ncbi:MAG TPA: hypothetical protein VMP13_02025 [Acidimicrobiia bacterium]|nr:hypothetical protein [Acidimicrobiia bacterium]
MSPRRSAVWVALALAVGSCGGGETEDTFPEGLGSGAETSVGAVEQLVDAVNAADFTSAGRMAVPGQAALAALAEGAPFGDVADALETGDGQVAVNFWSGFAQGAGSFLAGDVGTSEGDVIQQEDVEFHVVSLQPADGETRSLIVREADGYRVDIFASFGSGLADKMIGPVERLLTTQTDDARLILAELQRLVPSLLVAASLPGTTPEASQQLLALIEVITRVG